MTPNDGTHGPGASCDGLGQRGLDGPRRLAAAIAHRANDLLTAAVWRSDIVLDRLGPEDPSRRDLEAIRGGAERTATLIRLLVGVCGGPEPRRRNSSLDAALARFAPRLGPAPEKHAEPPPPAALVSRLSGGSETVVVVDDDAESRALACDVLQTHGYAVIEAGSGHEALRMLTCHAGPVHVLVTDIVMPRMSGSELVRRARYVHPEMRALYVSGDGSGVLLPHGVRETRVLRKPFGPDQLLDAVRSAIDGAPAGRRPVAGTP